MRDPFFQHICHPFSSTIRAIDAYYPQRALGHALACIDRGGTGRTSCRCAVGVLDVFVCCVFFRAFSEHFSSIFFRAIPFKHISRVLSLNVLWR